MNNKGFLSQTDSLVGRYMKKLPKLYMIILGVLITTFFLLLFNYLRLSSSYPNKMEEYNTKNESNEKLLKEMQNADEELRNINEYCKKNEGLIDEITNTIKNQELNKKTLADSVAFYQNQANSFISINEKTLEGVKVVKEEYAAMNKKLTDIQNEMYRRFTIDHSNILMSNLKEKELIEGWLEKKIKEPCYLSDVDGLSSHMFYKRCAERGPTVTLYQSSQRRFGGYTSTSWVSTGDPIYNKDPDTFLFSLDTKRKYLSKKTEKIILNSEGYFPSFGPKDILVSETSASSEFGDAYENTNEDKRALVFFKNDVKFDVVRIEVYLV